MTNVANGRLMICVLTLAATTLAACGEARRSEPLRGPLDLTAREAHGQEVFMRNCQKCHPGGEAGLGPGLNDKPVPDFLKRFQVRHGWGAMPSFANREISRDDLADLMAYLKVLKHND
jgi:mono/diheme cytochrome c family protein